MLNPDLCESVSRLYTERSVPIQPMWCLTINQIPELQNVFLSIEKQFPKPAKCIFQKWKYICLNYTDQTMSSTSVNMKADHLSDPCCSSYPCTTSRNCSYSHHDCGFLCLRLCVCHCLCLCHKYHHPCLRPRPRRITVLIFRQEEESGSQLVEWTIRMGSDVLGRCFPFYKFFSLWLGVIFERFFF